MALAAGSLAAWAPAVSAHAIGTFTAIGVAWDAPSTWTMELRDPATRTRLTHHEFAGSVVPSPPHVQNECVEHTLFDGMSDLAPGAWFDVDGSQEFNARTGTEHYVVRGLYLVFFVDVPS